MRRSGFQKPSPVTNTSNVGSKCQKCLQTGHWTADCTNDRVYKPRPSRTALLLNPKLKLPESNLIKDDFIDETSQKKEKVEKPTVLNVDPDKFTDQLFSEVKQSQMIRNDDYESRNSSRRPTHRSRSSRSLSPSPSRPRSRSPSRSRRYTKRTPPSPSRSPQYQSRSRRSPSPTPTPAVVTDKKIENPKKTLNYASDSDFSSDSE